VPNDVSTAAARRALPQRARTQPLRGELLGGQVGEGVQRNLRAGAA
jgi:hypothetical protein